MKILRKKGGNFSLSLRTIGRYTASAELLIRSPDSPEGTGEELRASVIMNTRVLANYLLLLMSTIFLILTAMNSIL